MSTDKQSAVGELSTAGPVLVEIDPDYARRNATLFTSFVAAIRQLCGSYTADQVRLIAQFLTAAARCQEEATEALST